MIQRLNLPQFWKKAPEKWALVLFSGLSLFFVLYIYEGYGIARGVSLSGHGLLFRSLVFALCTSVVFYMVEFHQSWTHNKFFRSLIGIGAGATVTFLLFNYFWNWTEWTPDAYLLLFFEYTCVMLFPLLLVRLWFNRISTVEGDEKASFIFRSENGKHLLHIHRHDLLCLSSSDNYVEIHYLSEGILKKELLRNTLKQIEEEQAEDPRLVRCHRGYLVNPEKVRHKRQKNGKTELDLGLITIPVSKKYQEGF